jgi:hypothetical protein
MPLKGICGKLLVTRLHCASLLICCAKGECLSHITNELQRPSRFCAQPDSFTMRSNMVETSWCRRRRRSMHVRSLPLQSISGLVLTNIASSAAYIFSWAVSSYSLVWCWSSSWATHFHMLSSAPLVPFNLDALIRIWYEHNFADGITSPGLKLVSGLPLVPPYPGLQCLRRLLCNCDGQCRRGIHTSFLSQLW